MLAQAVPFVCSRLAWVAQERRRCGQRPAPSARGAWLAFLEGPCKLIVEVRVERAVQALVCSWRRVCPKEAGQAFTGPCGRDGPVLAGLAGGRP